MRQERIKLVALLVVSLTAACNPAGDIGADTSTQESGSCTIENLPLVREGVLTVGTDSPAYPPWFIDDDPSNGQGFESAVAYAIADQLGFLNDEVRWVPVPFNASYQPGIKDFDFDINQISITPDRDEAVDFSDSYYTVNQALVGFTDSELAGATTLTDVREFELGAQVGTTGLSYIQEVIQPEQEPFVFDTTTDAKTALEAGRIQGIVADLPTAFFIAAVEIEGAAVVGQFPPAGEAEQFGMLFEEGNPLRDCVNQALAKLKEEGRLAEIEHEWLAETTGARLISED